MKNRYGDEYEFEIIDDNTMTITGNLKYWRFGGKEGQDHLDFNNLLFVDPSGGPFVTLGATINGKKIDRISAKDGKIYLHMGEDK